MNETKEMDRLSRHATDAKRMGMSYGKYMAMRYELGLKSLEKQEAEPVPSATPEREPKFCTICGKTIPPVGKRWKIGKYCSDECRDEGNRRIANARYKRKTIVDWRGIKNG